MHLGIKILRHGMTTVHEESDVIILQQVMTVIKEKAKVISDETDAFFVVVVFLYWAVAEYYCFPRKYKQW